MKVHESSLPLRPFVPLAGGPPLAITAPDPLPPTLAVRPWPDTVLDKIGFDPRSPYVERFWLSVLGPSCLLFLRRLATELESNPAGVELPTDNVARSLGLGTKGGRNSPLARTIARLSQFRLTHLDLDANMLLTRRRIPPLTRGQVHRLPEDLQLEHQEWADDRRSHPDLERMRQRGRRLALSLFELGEDVEATERQLHRWRFHPAVIREATAWAWQRHQDARAAADEAGGSS